MNLNMNNRVIHESWDHPKLIEARKSGDRERIKDILDSLKLPDGSLDISEYVMTEREVVNNLLTLEGKKYALDRITGVETTDPTWYLGLYESDSTPTASWNGDWANPTAGNATEFTDYDEATRQECAFDAATGDSRVSATNSVRATITVSTGVTNANIYGICVTDVSTKDYDGGAATLLAAVRFATAKVYNEGEVKSIGHEIYIP